MKNLSIFKFEPTTPSKLQHVATHLKRVAQHAEHAATNKVVICRVEMLRSLGRCLTIQQRTLVILVKWPRVQK